MSASEPTRGHRIARQVILGIVTLLCRIRVRGLEHVPATGPYVLAPNHLHWLDVPIVGVTLPHRATVFAAEKWERRPIVGGILRIFGDAIFVQRGELDRGALRKALRALDRGAVLAVAPEGTRSRTGGLQKGKQGAAYLAALKRVPIIPVVAYGQEKVFESLMRGRRAVVHVVYGRSILPSDNPGKVTREQLAQLTEEIMLRLAAMLPPSYRGVYADRVAERGVDLQA